MKLEITVSEYFATSPPDSLIIVIAQSLDHRVPSAIWQLLPLIIIYKLTITSRNIVPKILSHYQLIGRKEFFFTSRQNKNDRHDHHLSSSLDEVNSLGGICFARQTHLCSNSEVGGLMRTGNREVICTWGPLFPLLRLPIEAAFPVSGWRWAGRRVVDTLPSWHYLARVVTGSSDCSSHS